MSSRRPNGPRRAAAGSAPAGEGSSSTPGRGVREPASAAAPRPVQRRAVEGEIERDRAPNASGAPVSLAEPVSLAAPVPMAATVSLAAPVKKEKHKKKTKR